MNEEHENVDFQDWENQASEEIRLMLNDTRENSCPEESVQRALKAATEIGMTRAAWNRGMTISWIWGIPLFVIVNAVAFWIASQASTDWTHILLNAAVFAIATFIALGIASGIYMILTLRRDRKNTGAVLIDCGPHPGRNWHFVQPVIATSLTCLIAPLFPFWATLGMTAVACLAWLHALVMMRSRLTFCENGIWRHWNLLRWDQIQSHHWETGPTLLIHTGWTSSLISREALPIPAALQQQVNRLLIEHLSSRPAKSHSKAARLGLDKNGKSQ